MYIKLASTYFYANIRGNVENHMKSIQASDSIGCPSFSTIVI